MPLVMIQSINQQNLIIYVLFIGLITKNEIVNTQCFVTKHLKQTFFNPLPLQLVDIYLAHVIEQPIFRIPNLEYLQQNFVYLLDQQ